MSILWGKQLAPLTPIRVHADSIRGQAPWIPTAIATLRTASPRVVFFREVSRPRVQPGRSTGERPKDQLRPDEGGPGAPPKISAGPEQAFPRRTGRNRRRTKGWVQALQIGTGKMPDSHGHDLFPSDDSADQDDSSGGNILP